ncbi:MAG: spore maturation protein [Clostridia bacterium]|nr:spore maturation protein [Clostridia bacterium]
MIKAFSFVIPILFLGSLALAAMRKVKVYDSFTKGAARAAPLILSIFPFVMAVTVLTKLLSASGLEDDLLSLLAPAFRFFGIPEEIAGLILLKPLSGGGSIAMLADLLEKYGVDSYVARCACVAYGASDTVFYVAAVYFSGIKRKKLSLAIFFSLLAYFLSLIVCCALCRVI